MTAFVHVICDYAAGDLAWAEVMAAVTAHLPSAARFHMTCVHSFETVATGFVLGQLSLADEELRPRETIVFANCAPRKDLRHARTNNEGEGILYGVLNNGVRVLAVNSGYSLSFVKNELVELWSVLVDDRGSQFRSRDFYPKVLGALVRGESIQNHKLDPADVIPNVPADVIGYIDSFGNLKTTFRNGDTGMDLFKPGERVKVTIGGVIRTATVATGSFNVMEGDLAFAPGSSGHDRRYWEFFQRGGSAWHEFGKPAVGARITINHSYIG